MMLVGSRCSLVPWETRHERSLVAIADDLAVARYLTPQFPVPYRTDDARAWIALQSGREPPSHFAIESGGELAGSIGLEPGAGHRAGTLFVGYFLGTAFWGRGLATDALRTITSYGFSFARVHRMWANVYAPNVASMRVLEKAGYVREGVLRAAIVDRSGAIHDEHIFAKLREA